MGGWTDGRTDGVDGEENLVEGLKCSDQKSLVSDYKSHSLIIRKIFKCVKHDSVVFSFKF